MHKSPRFRLLSRSGIIYREENGKRVDGWENKDKPCTAEEYMAAWNSRLSPNGSHNDASLAAIGCKCEQLDDKWVVMKSPKCVWNETHRVWVNSVEEGTHFDTKDEAQSQFSGTAPYTSPVNLAEHAALGAAIPIYSSGSGLPIPNTDSTATLNRD